MRSLACFFVLSLFVLSTSMLNAQEGPGPVDPEYMGVAYGNTADYSYSAIVLNGPGIPYYPHSRRDLIFKFRGAGKSVIRASRGLSWGCYLQFLTTSDFSYDAYPQVRMHIDENGRVGIGTVNPSHTLTVNGTVRAKEVLVDVNIGADHVFNSGYNLKDLSEVKSFIEENKHLPDIPSEKEMQEKGLNMNEFQIKLLQKIEELTLYVIKQQKEMDEQQKEIYKLKQQIEK